MVLLPCLLIGFWLSKLVPMQGHPASRHVTFSFDLIYFALILVLVIAKVITSRVPGMVIWTDIIMCAILGLMIGRLSGICLRVRHLKSLHDPITR
jgi:hypothetical protein